MAPGLNPTTSNSPVFKLDPPATPEQEAQRLLDIHGGPETGLPAILKVLGDQFTVIHTRTQMLLTLGTITLTITGFSGFRIKEAGVVAQVSMAVGLAFVVVALAMILLVSLRVRWVTQFCVRDSLDHVLQIIRYRNWRTRMYLVELSLLLIGMSTYSVSLLIFVLS